MEQKYIQRFSVGWRHEKNKFVSFLQECLVQNITLSSYSVLYSETTKNIFQRTDEEDTKLEGKNYSVFMNSPIHKKRKKNYFRKQKQY